MLGSVQTLNKKIDAVYANFHRFRDSEFKAIRDPKVILFALLFITSHYISLSYPRI